jgi:GT2 family glycosyltransferase
MNCDYQNIEVLVVDDPFKGSYASDAIKDPRITIIKNVNEMFVAGSRNVGIYNSSGEYIYFVDSDNIIDQKSVRIMLEIMENDSNVGLIAPIAYYASDRSKIWKCGEYKTKFFRINKQYSVKSVHSNIYDIESMANAFIIRKDVIEKVGYFDQVNFPRDENEPDYYKRIRDLGYRTVMSVDAITYHDIESGRLVHFDPERIKESFKSRIWLDKKHRYKPLSLVAVYLAISIPYYMILSRQNRNYKGTLKNLIVKILDGLLEGLFCSPKLS